MAATYKDSPSAGAVNGSNKEFTYDFPVLQTEDVKVSLNGVTQATTKYDVSTTPAKITFNNNSVDGTVQESDGAPKSGVTVRVYRETTVGKANGDEDPKAVFAAGSSIRAGDLNANIEQALFGIHEQQEKIIQTEDLADDAVTSAKLDTNIDIAGTLDVTGAATLDSTLSVAGTTTAAAINASGAVGVDGDFDVNTNKFTVAASSGNTVVAGTLAAGATTVTGNIAVSGTVDGRDVATDGSKLDGIEAGATGNQTNAEIRAAVEAASDSNVFTDADHTKLNAAATLTDSQTLTNKTLTSPVINDMSGTAVVTSGTSTSDTKTYSAKRAGEIFYGKGTVEEIQSGETWTAADDKVATTSAIDARIVDLVDDVGGFVPIANETSFPNANPDVNNGAGTLVSIKALASNLVSNGSGVATIANGTVGNSTVTINGLANSTTYNSGFGMIVETTTTLNTYTFHRQVPKATEVTTVAGSISNVNTVAGAISNVNAVAADISDINAVAADATDIGAVAAKATEIGRLGTADAVADLALLGTTAVVEDLNLLGTSAVVADMALLGDSAVIADMATIADTSNLISNIGTVASAATNVNNVGGSIANVNTVAGNLASVNDFGARYRAATNNAGEYSSNNDAGDLYFNTDINALKVWTGSAWVAGVTQAGDYAVTTGDTFTGNLKLNDSVELRVGTGDDLKIFHDGSNSFIDDTGTGSLVVRSSDFLIRSPASAEVMADFHQNGAVELYYDNVKKFETTSTGVEFSGDTVKYPDSTAAKFGNGSDFSIYHDGTNTYQANSTGHLYIRSNTLSLANGSGNHDYLTTANEAGVSLYYDNLKKLETVSGGIKITSNSATAGIQIEAPEGQDSYIQWACDDGDDHPDFYRWNNKASDNTFSLENYGDSAWEKNIVAKHGGSVELYYDNSLSLETWADGVKIHDLENNTCELQLTSAQGDGGSLYADTAASPSGAFGLITTAAEWAVKSHNNGNVELHYDGTKTFETTSLGATITRDLTLNHATGDTAYRWAVGGTNRFSVYESSNTLRVYDNTNNTERLQFDGDKVRVPDNGKFSAGAGDDLQIYHESNEDKIFSTATKLEIRSPDLQLQNSGGEKYIVGTSNGAVELYYDHSKKAFTGSTGFNVSGNCDLVNDNDKLQCGQDGDLQIYHSGSHSFITNTTGKLFLRSDTGIVLQDAGGNESFAEFNDNGGVELYHDNIKTFETMAYGAYLYGPEGGTCNLYIYADEGDDDADKWRIRNGDPNGSLTIQNYASGAWETNIKAVGDGAVELYYDNSKKFETTSAGVSFSGDTFMPDSEYAHFGTSNDMYVGHDGTDTVLYNNTGNLLIYSANDFYLKHGTEVMFAAKDDGATELYHDGTKKLETTSGGIEVSGGVNCTSGNISLPDSSKIKLGAGDDLEIYHSGSNSFIKQVGTGDLYIQADNGETIYLRPKSNEDGVKVVNDAHVSLYYDGSQKFYTQSDKCVVAGHFYPEANNTYDLGNASYKWANVYTNDLHLSNEGSSNDVDGTWGDWTLQEGESDLFLKNNRSGKKYKFNLTEVS